MSESRHVCPSCMEGDGLWESVIVQGWRSIDEHLQPEGERDIDWSTAESDGWASPEVGCSCGWDGARRELVAMGIDDLPLRRLHPDQMEIEAA